VREYLKACLKDDSGLILRGPAAVVAIVVVGVIALFDGPRGKEIFFNILIVSVVLTGLGMLFSSGRRDGTASSSGSAIGPAPATFAAAGWYSDPMQRHAHRYWDGAVWTMHVADQGVMSTDPIG
jgi:hypothetical protein